MKTHNAHSVNRSRPAAPGFTLIELLVTISIIALVLGIAGPTTMRLFTTSADTQAYTVFSTQMALARAGAIEAANYVGLHCQITDATTTTPSHTGKAYVDNNKLADKCITAIVAWDEANNAFDLKTGEVPQEMPGGMAFGQIDSTYVNTSNAYLDAIDTDMAGFTTFTILFNPDGEIAKTVNSSNIRFLSASPLFATGTNSTGIWTLPTEEQGVSCVTMFNYLTFKSKAEKKSYLNESGQFIAANIYTGRLFARE